MAKHPDNGSPPAADHIEQIRDIILGPQKRDYDDRFKRIATDIGKCREETRTQIEERAEALQSEITAARRSFEAELHETGSKLRQEAADLQKQLERAIAGFVDDLSLRLKKGTEANEALRNELATTKTKLQSDIRSAEDKLSHELETHVAALREGKISKEALAEMLGELSLRLKGSEVLEELTKAARKKNGE